MHTHIHRYMFPEVKYIYWVLKFEKHCITLTASAQIIKAACSLGIIMTDICWICTIAEHGACVFHR